MTTLTENTTQLEQRLTAYDDACAKLQATQAEREAIQAHHEETRDNDELSAIDRAKKVVHLKSMVDVLTSDESRQQKVVDELKRQVFELSDELHNYAAGQVNSAIHDRIESLLSGLREQYDTNVVHGLQTMLETHPTIRALKEIQGGLQYYPLRDADGKLHDARRFRRDVLEKLRA
jgi:hypothetical protein